MKHAFSSRKPATARRQAGFTIVELMIATLVFSVILVVITTGVLHFSSAYYKGINSSTTQTATAGVMNAVSQAIQFSPASSVQPPAPLAGDASTKYLCAGNQEFLFKPGVQEPAGVSIYQFNTGGTCYNSSNSADATYYGNAPGWDKRLDLLQDHMRLAQLKVTGLDARSWNVTVKVAYGDDDLLCAPTSDPGSCAASAANLTDFTKDDLTCRPGNGSQFCNVSTLSTTVVTRLR